MALIIYYHKTNKCHLFVSIAGQHLLIKVINIDTLKTHVKKNKKIKLITLH